VNRRAFLLGLAGCACRSSASPPLPFARAALRVARVGPGFADEERASLAELRKIAALADQELKRAPLSSLGVVLSELLFDRLGFVREVTDTDLRFVFLSSVLRERRGSCVGLGTLFLSLAEALGRPASGVLMPGHFYVRIVEHGVARNVELLRRGEAMPDAWYKERFPIPGGGAPEYGRPLSAREVLGVIEYDVGNEHRRTLRLTEARAAYARAVLLFSDFAEAHASLGATLQVLGELDQAALSYGRARAANPHLAGVDWNIAVLEEQRRALRSAGESGG
jgi:regulator of sirC expression with transglutaminase-like and TPR domain